MPPPFVRLEPKKGKKTFYAQTLHHLQAIVKLLQPTRNYPQFATQCAFKKWLKMQFFSEEYGCVPSTLQKAAACQLNPVVQNGCEIW